MLEPGKLLFKSTLLVALAIEKKKKVTRYRYSTDRCNFRHFFFTKFEGLFLLQSHVPGCRPFYGR